MRTLKLCLTLALALLLTGCPEDPPKVDAGPVAPPDGQVDEGPDHSALGAQFVDLLVAGNYDEAVARFDPKMKEAMKVDRLKAVWEQVIEKSGAFQQRTGVMTTQQKQYRIALVSCRFKGADLTVKVVFSGEQVAGLFFLPAAADSAKVAKKGEVFVDLLAAGEFAKAQGQFDGALQLAMPAGKLSQIWKSVLENKGQFEKRLGTKTTRQDKYDIALVNCRFSKMDVTVKVVFSADSISGLFFLPTKASADEDYHPPAYANKTSFTELEVKFGQSLFQLPATLSLPLDGKQTHPAVVLVHGSGPQDRDETIGPNKIFKDLAWGLASKGVVVLRYDKRTRAYAEKMAALKNEITVKSETVQDAALAVRFLLERGEVDKSRVYVLGHSLGGMLMPRIANLSPKAAGFIVMAGNSRPLEDLVVEQYDYIFGLDGALSDFETSELDRIKKQAALVKSKELSLETPAEDLPLGVPAPYWLDLRNYNAPRAAKNISQPMLFLQGERDYQVTTRDFNLWKKTLSKKSNAQFKLYPALNHLFIPGQGKSKPAEYQTAGHVAEEVIDDLAAFVLK